MGWDSGWYENDWWDRSWWFDGLDTDTAAAQAAAEQEREDAMHFNAAKARRERQRQTALVAASTEMKPAAEPAPITPDPALVARIAAQLTNVRRTQGTTSGFGGGVFLPPS